MPHRLRVPLHFPHPSQQPRRPLLYAVLRGLMLRCPHCGIGHYRRGYLTVVDHCAHCGEALGHIRADDGPAYFTVLIAGHVVVPGMLLVEQTWAPPVLPHAVGALLVMAGLIWGLLPPIKGAVLGWMWALRLHGRESHDH